MTQLEARVDGVLVSPDAPLEFTVLNGVVTVAFRFDEPYRNTVAIPIILPAGFVARIDGAPVTEVPAHFFTNVDAEIDFAQTASLPHGSSPSVVIALGDEPSAIELIPDTTGPTLAPAFTLVGGEGSLTFDWDAATDAGGVDHYEYEYSANSGMTSPTTATTVATGAVVAPAAGTWYGRYRAVDTTGNASAWSAVLSAVVASTQLANVTNFQAVASSSADVVLNWPSVAGAQSYTIEWGTDGVAYPNTIPGVVPQTYTHAGRTANTTYHYRIKAVAAGGATSAAYATAAATTFSVADFNAFDKHTGSDFFIICTQSGYQKMVGQGCAGDGKKLAAARFLLTRVGSPTGNLTAKLYAHSGTFGTSGVGTGAALATSSVVVGSSIPTYTDKAVVIFAFDKTFTLVNGTKYVIVVDASGTGSDSMNNYWAVGHATPDHAGNACKQSTSNVWAADTTLDYVFSVETV